MNDLPLKLIVEAILLSGDEPLTLEKIQSAFGVEQQPSISELKQAISDLDGEYETRAFEVKHVASGYRIQTKQSYNPWIMRLNTEKPTKYSKALLETLAIIAYKQPITRGEIEDIRGVSVSSSIIKTLQEREWICIGGYRDIPGKPAVYVTTKSFLDYFNLAKLDDLPELPKEIV